jgi:tetratricopeptide (TPR) repeat protein
LSRDPHSHLSPEELAGLAEETESAWQASGADPGRDQAKAHAEGCGVCGPRLRNHRSVQARLQSMVSPVASERTSVCPAEGEWLRLAAGLAQAEEAPPLLEHAATCDYCGPLLRAATEDLNPEISAEEQEFIRQLPSARAEWQRDLARKMADTATAQAAENDVVPVNESERRVERVRPASSPSRTGWNFASWNFWAAPLTAAAVVAIGAAIWFERQSPSLSSTNQLIAQAYSEQRPIELRFPGASYGPVRQERGGSGPNHSRMDEPPQLLQAETQIARGLARHPQDAGWLQAKARADLFEGNYQSAIELLQQAEPVHPEDASLKIDLATAYYERAGTRSAPTERTADYERAVQALNSVLSENPNDLVALFNRAMVYKKLGKYSETIEDWKRYLQIDPAGTWAEEAQRQLK